MSEFVSLAAQSTAMRIRTWNRVPGGIHPGVRWCSFPCSGVMRWWPARSAARAGLWMAAPVRGEAVKELTRSSSSIPLNAVFLSVWPRRMRAADTCPRADRRLWCSSESTGYSRSLFTSVSPLSFSCQLNRRAHAQLGPPLNIVGQNGPECFADNLQQTPHVKLSES
jgi:hypothetical protein